MSEADKIKRLMEELLFLLIDGQPIGPKLVHIAMEGWTTQFRRDGESIRMLVTIYRYDDMGTKIQLTQAIDAQLMLEGR